MRLRLKDAKDSLLLRERTKLVPSDKKFGELVNSAQRILMESGNWWGTYQRMRICLHSGCVTWPRQVARVAGLQMCYQNLHVRNSWYEFQEYVEPPRTDCQDCRDSQMLDRGNTPTFLDIAPPNKKLRLYNSSPCDADAIVTIQGLDQNGQPIRTQVDGIRIEGEPLKLTSPYVESVSVFSSITGVQKPETVGTVRLYEVDTNSSTERLLAEYEPGETNPWYRRSYITHLPTVMPNKCCSEAANGDGCNPKLSCDGVVVVCLVKLEPIPATVDSDWLVLNNFEALGYEMGSILASLRNEEPLSLALHNKALKSLQDELTNRIGRQNHNINVQVHGSAKFDRVMAGFM